MIDTNERYGGQVELLAIEASVPPRAVLAARNQATAGWLLARGRRAPRAVQRHHEPLTVPRLPGGATRVGEQPR